MAKLTDLAVRRAKDPGVLIDGAGLRLRVHPAADGGVRKSWVLRTTVRGRGVREIGLGPFPVVSLAQARAEALEMRRLARAGVDPLAERRRAQAAEAAIPTFRDEAEAYLAAHGPSWRNPKHAAQWAMTLRTYAYPVLGETPLDAIDTALVLRALQPIWLDKPETASRVRLRIEAVLDAASAKGLRAGANPARWRGHLDALLPAKGRVRPPRHFAAAPIDDMPDLWRALGARSGPGADALRFVILTACRSGEARFARWGEIDLDAAVWTVPAARMKAKREHRVPLSAAALALLRGRRGAGAPDPDAWVFPSEQKSGAALSDMTLSAALRRLGRAETVHGFRSTFRDWAAERTDFAREVAEAALAHTIGDKVEAAYRRGDLFAKRRALMDAWAGFIES